VGLIENVKIALLTKPIVASVVLQQADIEGAFGNN